MKTASAKKRLLRSFPPLADGNSRVLILGTMPGPVALAKREYYGFPGNHFWKIMADLFGVNKPMTYEEKKDLLRKNRIALWDVFKSCEREGALDSAIRCAAYNDIPGLLAKYPGIRAIFLNSRTAEKTFLDRWASQVTLPYYYLPSTSPANAGLSYARKLAIWEKALAGELK